MVTVGDIQLSVGKLGGKGSKCILVIDCPKRMSYAVGIGKALIGSAARKTVNKLGCFALFILVK